MPSIEDRINRESTIVEKIVSDALAAGYTISIFDSEEWCVKKSKDKGYILENVNIADEMVLRLRDAKNEIVGGISLVYGNDTDVISDYTATDIMEEFMKEPMALANKMGEDVSLALIQGMDVG